MEKYCSFVGSQDISDDDKSSLMEKINDTDTIWDAFNYITYYTTHEMKTRGKNALASRRKRSLELAHNFYKYNW